MIMESKPLSQQEFDAKRAEALKNEPMTSKINLNSLELTKDSYSSRSVILNGVTVAANEDFFKSLGNMLHISSKMQSDLTSGEFGRKKLTGQDSGGLFAKMVDALKLLKSSTGRGGNNVTIIGNPITGELDGISDKGYGRISNKDLFDTAEMLLNQYPILSPIGVDVTNGGMGVGIQLLSSADHPFAPTGADGIKLSNDDESFRFGMTLDNGDGTTIGDFAYRMLCSNGMMGLEKKQIFTMQGTDNESIRKMFDVIAQAEQRLFVPQMFEENLILALQTQASFREIEKVYTMVTGCLAYNASDDTLRKHFQMEIASNFFRGYLQVQAKLAARGIDPTALTPKQKAFISTGQSMWDVINSITWLGSHDAGYQWSDKRDLRKVGGHMMAKEYDLAYAGLMNL